MIFFAMFHVLLHYIVVVTIFFSIISLDIVNKNVELCHYFERNNIV